MRVDLAAQVIAHHVYMLTDLECKHFLYQVLSESVAKAIQLTQGQESEETVRFITMFDRFFDCFNVRCFNAGKHQRKPFKQPYRSGNDFRLKVCTMCVYTHNTASCLCSCFTL